MCVPCCYMGLFSNKAAAAICQDTNEIKLSLHCVSFRSMSLSLSAAAMSVSQTENGNLRESCEIAFALMKVISLRTRSRLIHSIRIDSDCSVAHFFCLSHNRQTDDICMNMSVCPSPGSQIECLASNL